MGLRRGSEVVESPVEVVQEPPAGFVPLPGMAKGRILEVVGREYATDFPQTSRFLASGTPVAPSRDFDREETPVEFQVVLDLPVVAPRRGTDRRAVVPEVPKVLGEGERSDGIVMGPSPLAFVPPEIFAQLDEWFVTAAPGPKRTWRRGMPWPTVETPVERWEPLSRGVLRTISRRHEELNNSATFPGWGMSTNLCYSPADGRFVGNEYDVSLGTPLETPKCVRVPQHWDSRDVDWSAFRRDPATGKISDAVRLPDTAA